MLEREIPVTDVPVAEVPFARTTHQDRLIEAYDEAIEEAEAETSRRQIETVKAKDEVQRRQQALANARAALAEFQELWPKSDMDDEDKYLVIQEMLVDDMEIESLDDMLRLVPQLIVKARTIQRRRMDALDSLFELAMHQRARR